VTELRTSAISVRDEYFANITDINTTEAAPAHYPNH
jgi:hypothetical protein